MLGVAVKVTDPAGVPEPLPDGDTLAVKVTISLESCGFADDMTTVVVGVTTDWLKTEDVDPAKLPSPP